MTNMAAMPIYGKNLKNLLLWNQKAIELEIWHAASSTWVLSSLFKGWPWVDHDLFYSKVKFAPLYVCMGTHFNSRFPGNYWSLYSGSWHIKSTKWVHKDLWAPKVKVIHWPLASVTQMSSISNICFKPSKIMTDRQKLHTIHFHSNMQKKKIENVWNASIVRKLDNSKTRKDKRGVLHCLIKTQTVLHDEQSNVENSLTGLA